MIDYIFNNIQYDVGNMFNFGDNEYHFTQMLESGEADVLIPGEIVDWTTVSYVTDAARLGKAKAIINLGHYNLEEPGVWYAAESISKLIWSIRTKCILKSSNGLI